jgi:hypothetical protein
MKFAENLSKKEIAKHNQLRHKPKEKKRDKEKLSYRDIEELMGVYQDTYKRVNGAVRRK